MAKYRQQLPQLSGDLFLTDGGLETCLIFHDGIDLPDFAAFDLLKDDTGRSAVDRRSAIPRRLELPEHWQLPVNYTARHSGGASAWVPLIALVHSCF